MRPLDEQVDELIELLKETSIPISGMQMYFTEDGLDKYIDLTQYAKLKKQGRVAPAHLTNPNNPEKRWYERYD